VRSARFLLNFLSRAFGTSVTLVIGLIATPLILHWLGDERFGAFQVASDWLAYVSLLEFGLGAALLPLLAIAVGHQNIRSIHGLMVTAIRSYVKVAVAMLVATIALAAAINWLVPVGQASSQDLRAAILICLIGVALMPLAPFRGLAEAEQQAYWISWFLLLQSLVITAGSLVLAWAGWGITGQAIALTAGTVVFNLALVWLSRREFFGLVLSAIFEPSHDESRIDIRRLNLPSFAFNICGRISYMTDNIIIARFLSPAMVATFFLTQRLAMVAQSELQGIGNASWAGLTELSVQGHNERFNQRLVELTRAVAVLGFAVLGPILLFNHAFVALWVGSQRYGGEMLSILACVNAMMFAIFSLWGWCVSGTGQIRRILPMTTIQTVLNFVLSLAFTFAFGLVGPVLGTTVAFLAVSAWYLPRVMTELFGTPGWDLISAVMFPAFIAIPYAAIVWLFARNYEATGWFGIAYHMALAATVYLGLSWLLVFGHDERADMVNRFRMAVRAVAV
jgi:O-antigen/teichoic acid export membrane protein